MTTLSTTDSTADLIETLTIAVAAVGILDDETRSKHGPRMERLLAAAQEPSASQPDADLLPAERVEYAVEWMSNGPHPTRWVGQWSTFDTLEDAQRLAGYSHVHYPKILRRVTTATPWEQVEGTQS